jgi:hypothetical protein
VSAYPFLLFVHILGTAGIFAALTLEAAAVSGLRRAPSPEVARLWLRRIAPAFPLGPLAMLATLASGMALAALGWGRPTWAMGGLLGLLAMALGGGGAARQEGRRLRGALATGRALPDALRAAGVGKALAASVGARLAVGAAVLALMTFKPGGAGTALALVSGGLAAGGVALVMLLRRGRPDPGPVAGGVFPPRALAGVAGGPVPVPDASRLVHLQLRRFAGCPVCNLHLSSFARRADELVRAGVREVVVFHSPAGELAPHVAGLPFTAIADPEKRLYAELGVEAAPRAMLDPRAWPTILRALTRSLWAIVRGREHAPALRPHGGRLGLPADLLVAPDGRVVASHRGVHAADHWEVDEVLALAAASSRAPETPARGEVGGRRCAPDGLERDGSYRASSRTCPSWISHRNAS